MKCTLGHCLGFLSCISKTDLEDQAKSKAECPICFEEEIKLKKFCANKKCTGSMCEKCTTNISICPFCRSQPRQEPNVKIRRILNNIGNKIKNIDYGNCSFFYHLIHKDEESPYKLWLHLAYGFGSLLFMIGIFFILICCCSLPDCIRSWRERTRRARRVTPALSGHETGSSTEDADTDTSLNGEDSDTIIVVSTFNHENDNSSDSDY